MKNLILTLFVCFFIYHSYGQNKILSGDTTFWGKLSYQNCEKIGLPHLISSTDKFHFRFWTDEQAVDIWTTDNLTFNGLVTSFTNSYEPENIRKRQQKPSNFFYKQVYLDTSAARKAFELTKKVAAIPTDKSIKGWTLGDDGVEYIFEASTPSAYSFRTYWTPTAQRVAITEAKMIQTFVKNLDSVLSLSRKYDQFFATLQPGSYSDGTIVTTKLTPQQAKNYRKTKPYGDYLESIKDTLNQYLTDTLTKIFDKYDAVETNAEFLLKFSRDNKLLKITTDSEFINKEDKRQFLSCRKKIVAAFKLIKIDFVHSPVPYWKRLDFSRGKPEVSQ